MNKNSKIYVAGHKGLVGSAIMRKLHIDDFTNLLYKTIDELDLRNQNAVNTFFSENRPEYVFLAAARVGGIKANNDFPAQFIYENLMISANVIHAAYRYGVQKLFFLGSSCIYPRLCPQPMREDHLLTGSLEKTNEPYAIAKIAGINLCQSYNRQYGTHFIACMPTNLYGPGDNFDLETSHVLPALIAKMYQGYINNASEVTIWGTGKALREFLFVDDLADAAVFLMKNYDSSQIINVGVGQDISIVEVAHVIKEIVGFKGNLVFDTTKPDGTPRKLLNVDKIHALGWKAKVSLQEGIARTLEWYKNSCFLIEHKKSISPQI